MVHIAIHNGSINGDKQKLEIFHTKLQNICEKYEIIKSTYSIS